MCLFSLQTKMLMGEVMREAAFSLAEAKFTAGDFRWGPLICTVLLHGESRLSFPGKRGQSAGYWFLFWEKSGRKESSVVDAGKGKGSPIINWVFSNKGGSRRWVKERNYLCWGNIHHFRSQTSTSASRSSFQLSVSVNVNPQVNQ